MKKNLQPKLPRGAALRWPRPRTRLRRHYVGMSRWQREWKSRSRIPCHHGNKRLMQDFKFPMKLNKPCFDFHRYNFWGEISGQVVNRKFTPKCNFYNYLYNQNNT